MDGKEASGRAAVAYIQDGMKVGIGTGTTAVFFIRALGERIQRENLHVQAVPTSAASRELAEQLGIPLVDLSDISGLDVTVDGADEVDAALHLIKGGGGALVREKIVATASQELIIICDDSKYHPVLGTHPLPVAVLPFGHASTHRQLLHHTSEATLRLALDGSGKPFVSDDGLYIYDLHMGAIPDPTALEQELKRIVGVAEVGLFVGLTKRLIIGHPDGSSYELLPPANSPKA